MNNKSDPAAALWCSGQRPEPVPDAGGVAYMPLVGMGAIRERPAGAGPIARNDQSRWLLSGARGRGHYLRALLAPRILRRGSRALSQAAESFRDSGRSKTDGCLRQFR